MSEWLRFRGIVSVACAVSMLMGMAVPAAGTAEDRPSDIVLDAGSGANGTNSDFLREAIIDKKAPAALSVLEFRANEAPDMDTFEPDNIWEQAKRIPLGGGTQTHSFHSPTDVDWHHVDISAGDVGNQYRLTAEAVDPASGIDTVLVVYDAEMNVVAFNDDSEYGLKTLDSTIVWFPPHAGRYYVRCFEFSSLFGAGKTGWYQVSINFVSLPGALDPNEPNNVPRDARPLSAGQTQLRVDFEGDAEWFYFEANAGSYYRFETANLLPTGLGGADTVMWLYDTDAATLIQYHDDVSYPADLSSRIGWLCTASGRYYLKLNHFDNRVGDGANAFTYELNYMPNASFPNLEHQDAYDTAGDNLQRDARYLEIGVTAEHTHHFDGDADWHRFQANGKEAYRITANFGTPATAKRLALYDGRGELVAEETADAPGSMEIYWYCPTSAEYYVVIEDAFDGAVSPTSTYSVLVVRETQLPAIQTSPLAGDRRYETAVQISRNAFLADALAGQYVVVATGESFPDALSAASVCGAYGSPLLLTQSDRLPAAVADEIRRLGAEYAIIIGGERAIDEDTAAAIGSATKSGQRPIRISGTTRWETAKEVAKRTQMQAGSEATKQVFIASGRNFPDALAASAWAAKTRSPILLVDGTSADLRGVNNIETRTALELLNVNKAYIVGGSRAVPLGIEEAVKAKILERHDAQSPPVVRLEGASRYETARVVAEAAIEEGVLSWSGPALATGERFPDALAGGPSQAANNSVMLLTHPVRTIDSVGALAPLVSNRLEMLQLRYLGSESVVPQHVRQDIARALNIQQSGF